MAGELTAFFNAFICAVIVIVLMFYQRHGARHRPFISIMAYVTVLVYAVIPLQFIFGLYRDSSWLVVVANLLICAAVMRGRGNLARLVDHLRH
ncbi:TPA: phage holin family protein [Enterobacter hormaechei subsp. hoffmannii]|uniref:phage holin family protein n=1 Tax=Enterobacter cloacae complex TaxID=354276 RepID=UPI00079B98FC|nr:MULTISPECIES: phage holin family protein [Enterobacter cloacae complex]MDW2986773.1 phage holin family protein [Enterobacter cloacae complex sp. 2023EL-01177]SAF59600.1 putative prophage membrane protein [Enterobacter hormaechei]SAG56272.1 putative prophage membrane protein [Enterobacter hormaechei]VAC57334.1 putative prophage membrane protein [Enterobacter hormaechei]HCD1474571.1 phage holin family protein [Enterobacter hormaechei]